MNYDIAKIGLKENEQLQKVRREFDILKNKKVELLKKEIQEDISKEKKLIDEQIKNKKKEMEQLIKTNRKTINQQKEISYNVSSIAVKETEKLQKARRDLDLLRKEEDKFLEDRQEKAQALLVNTDKQINSAQAVFNSVIDKISNQIKDYKDRFEKFTNGLNSTVDRADKMMNSIVLIGKKTEKVEKFIGEKYAELQGFEKVLGTKDKDITLREIEVEKMMKKADYKLKETYTLADWAKKGKRYTIKKNVK